MTRRHPPRDRREHPHPERPPSERRLLYSPREVFFFGFDFAGNSLPAAAARADALRHALLL
jgi:hypothetical protein